MSSVNILGLHWWFCRDGVQFVVQSPTFYHILDIFGF